MKKQPIMLTKKISSNCHLNKAPLAAPIETKKNLFFPIELLIIYQSLSKKDPKAKAEIPKEKEKKNSLNALKKFNLIAKSNIS